jgi:regulator of RNase E activity RraA
MNDAPRPADRYNGLPTAAVSDALDRLGLPGSLHGIRPLRAGQRAVGPAYTVAYEPVDDRPGTVGDFLDDVEPGSVVVIANDGRTDCTVWCGIMTQVAAHRGVSATVIDGVCRDVETSSSVDYPIWSAGRFMRTGRDRVRLRAVQEPVVIDGVTVRPGDFVCCDEDGVVVVPAGCTADVAEVAHQIEKFEARIVTAVLEGSTLADARAAHGYGSLQIPEDVAQQEAWREHAETPDLQSPDRPTKATDHAVATLYEAAVATVRDLPTRSGWAPCPGQLFALDPAIRAVWAGATVSGPAFTVQGAGGDNLALHRAAYAASAGSVLVVDVNGAPFGHWGEVLTVAAQVRGIAGLVIDGGVRDSREMGDLNFPVFSRGTSVRGTRKQYPGELGTRVEVGGVLVRTGDLIVGNADGVIALPSELAARVVERADTRARQEHEIFDRLRAGGTTLEVYELRDDTGA